MAESAELFELKNYFTIGNYQAAINAGIAVSHKSLSEADKVMRDVYIYRSYIVQKNYKFVLAEIKDSAPTPLQAVKLLATYLTSPDNKEISLVTVKEWMSDGAVASNPVLQVVAATIYYYEENYEEAMRCVYQSNSLEG
jgi:coatomer protein complex subunit epsilon